MLGVVFTLPHVHEEVRREAGSEEQTGCLLGIVTTTDLMLVRLEYLTVGRSALARQLLDVSLSRMKMSLPLTAPRIFISGFMMYRIAHCWSSNVRSGITYA